MKNCLKCGQSKPLDDFYRHPGMADGHLNKCKACAKCDVRQHRQTNAESVRAYDRQRAKLPHRREKTARVVRAWSGAHPDRRRAQVVLGNAVRSGRVKPWPVCAMHSCNDKPEAHHPDYSRPLDVVWLCPAHHKQAHALLSRLVQPETHVAP